MLFSVNSSDIPSLIYCIWAILSPLPVIIAWMFWGAIVTGRFEFKSDRSKTLENYLKQLGYNFTAEEVEKVVNLPRKRKVGTRPKNLRKLKNVK